MATRIQVYDGLTPVIDFIAKTSFGLARESLSVTGSHLTKNAQASIKKHQHFWHHILKNSGKRIIYKSRSQRRTLGSMSPHSKDGKTYGQNISDFITFYMPKSNSPSALSVTIGGAHKSFMGEIRERGKILGHKRVHGVSKETRSIFHKLNTGELDKYHPYKKGRTIERFKNAKYIARPYMFQIGSMSERKLLSSLEERYIQVLPTLVNNKNFKLIKVAK